MRGNLKFVLITFLAVGAVFYLGRKFLDNSPAYNRQDDLANTISSHPNRSNDFSLSNKDKECSLPSLPQGAEKLVTKVIDGDTILIEGGYSVRLLGIDADERGHKCYYPVQERLEELILNKKARFYKGRDDHDKYCRYLRYVFSEEENIGATLAREGLVVARWGGGGQYEEEIQEAEKEAREKKQGCKWQEENSLSNKKFSWQHLTPEQTGLPLVEACSAQNFLGQEAIVEGEVVDTYRSRKNNIFLNFTNPYPRQCFSGVIFSSSLSRFSSFPEKFFRNKTVRVKGRIQEYKGRLEIIIDDPQQIEIGQES